MSETASVSAKWQTLSDCCYRKSEVYQMQWKDVDLSLNKVAAAPFGGPIAVISSEDSSAKLRVFNSAGLQLSEMMWRNPGGRLIGMSWTDDQTLVCITQDGSVFMYDMDLKSVRSVVSMGDDCFTNNVVDCVFWGNGVVCTNEAFKLFCIHDFRNPVSKQLPETRLKDFPHCVAVTEPKDTLSGKVEVFLAVADHISVMESDFPNVNFEVGRIQKMAVSPNANLLAAFTYDGRLQIIKKNFKESYIVHKCESVLPPKQLAWCGNDSVLLYWDDKLFMVGINGFVQYFYNEPLIIIPECDGARILSNTRMEFLQRVPDSTLSIFKVGSIEPAALLYDALDYIDQRSAKADGNLGLIFSLPEAVETCIDAAGQEFSISLQQKLLKAGSYGQAVCSRIQLDRIQEMCQTLRVLNAVRNQEIGICLSIQQYKYLTPSLLIGRLINLHHHLLAFKISEYLGMDQEVVIVDWACSKITASSAIPDDNLYKILDKKLKLCKGISYAAVAAHADKNGRRKLAAMLVENEPRSSKQVPLLLSIGDEDAALMKATESGDTDLVYQVLFHIWQKKYPGSKLEFFGMIRARKLVGDLFSNYARCYNHDILKSAFRSSGQLKDAAFLFLKESWELAGSPIATEGETLNGKRIKLIEEAYDIFSQTKEHVFESKAAEEHAKLLRMQYEFEETTKLPIFVDSSISATICTCIVLGNLQAALKLKTEFEVSEKQWYWLKVSALAKKKDWNALENFSKEERPPFGYRPFVEVCIDADQKGEALKYIPELEDPREKAEAYARIGMAKEAADAASQAEDGKLSTFVQNAAANKIFDTLRNSLSFLVHDRLF